MRNLHHPDDERLAALASRDDDATADAALTSHVASCARCTDLLGELGALRASLADLPDLRPHRPLQLLPPVVDARATDGAAGWIRRVFGPVLAAGAALAMVGLVGTATPALDSMASGAGGADLFQDAGSALEAPAAEEGAARSSGVPESSDAGAAPAEGGGEVSTLQSQDEDAAEVEPMNRELPAERSPWPMVLFTGVALMVGIGLLRWILVPRAG
jgi:hypothetical protein